MDEHRDTWLVLPAPPGHGQEQVQGAETSTNKSRYQKQRDWTLVTELYSCPVSHTSPARGARSDATPTVTSADAAEPHVANLSSGKHSSGSRGGGSGAQAPPCPQDFFKIMQFSGNFKGKTPIFSKFRDQAPFGVQTLLGPPGQNPGFATSLILDPRLKLQRN